MNLLLLSDEDFTGTDIAVVRGPRLRHIREILKLGPGESLRAGRRGGAMGRAVIESLSAEAATLRCELSQPPLHVVHSGSCWRCPVHRCCGGS